MEKDDKIADKNKIMANIRYRKNYHSDFKAKVALEAVKGRLTINEISKEFGVHPNQISRYVIDFEVSNSKVYSESGWTHCKIFCSITTNQRNTESWRCLFAYCRVLSTNQLKR